ncbi:MAG: (deoxy)nucleoside triphosphate pyrophosphohydrolase [Marmoricola sp.]|nr:(deoxy)nucleoside triphosphate pyrophosphohydrolase [Marmoricola sp.]
MTLVVGAAILRGGRVLAARRNDDGTSGGWEFPGGKVEPGEQPQDAVVREVREELGCEVVVTGWLEPTVLIRDGLELRVATARLVDGEPLPSYGDHDAVRWLAPDQYAAVAWLEADLPFMQALADRTVPGAH